MRRPPLLLLAAGLILAGCGGDPTEGQLWGTGAGAATGAGIGRAVAVGTHYPWAFTGAGLVAGAVVGYAVGDAVDPPAARQWAAATVAAADRGEAVAWATATHQGDVVPTGPAWRDAGGRDCRPLRQTARRLGGDGPGFTRESVACRVDETGWEVLPASPATAPDAPPAAP